jgi:hypothetical protein
VPVAAGVALSLAAPLPASAAAGEQAVAPSPETVPSRGMHIETVLERWGHPARFRQPVGEPPITRLLYEGFTVYLEWDRVIESVRDTDIPRR